MDHIEGFTMLLPSPRRSGKSVFLKWSIRKWVYEYDYIFIFCPTAKKNRNFDEFKVEMSPRERARIERTPLESINDLNIEPEDLEFLREITVPEDFQRIEQLLTGTPRSKRTRTYTEILPVSLRAKIRISTECDENEVQRLISEQEEAFDAAVESEQHRPPKTLFIFDDCVNESIFNQFQGIFSNVATIGRHSGISLVATSQQLNRIPKVLRINGDYMVILQPFAISELEGFLEQFVLRHMRKAANRRFSRIYTIPKFFIIVDNSHANWMEKIKFSWTQAYTEGHSFSIRMDDMV